MGTQRRRIVWRRCEGALVRGRIFTQTDLVLIRKLIRSHPTWGRTKLSIATCELLGWIQPSGRPKDRACRVALRKLEEQGFLRLPKRIVERGGKPPLTVLFAETDTQPMVTAMPHFVECRRVVTSADRRLWNSLIASYHYLGLSRAVGRGIRYLVFGDDELIAAISFADCVWSCAPRDLLLSKLGYDAKALREVVITNNRFLILQTVTVPNLASRILAVSVRCVTKDWQQIFGLSPHFIETFVDPRRYKGTCYRAANWNLIGKTKGFSKQGDRHTNDNSPKMIFVIGADSSRQYQLRSAMTGYIQRAA